MLLRARYVIPVDSPPIKNGAVRIERGKIAEVGSAKRISGTPKMDFGDAVILPGFINAHTHLELTHWAGKVPPGSNFVDWLGRLRAATRDVPIKEEAFADAAHEGQRLSLHAGVTTVGDITSRPRAVRPALTHGPLRVISFGEVIATGAIRSRLGERLEAALDTSETSDYLTPAVSPHALYTVEPDGVRACVEAATARSMRLCLHLAETREEVRFTERGDGPFRDYLEQLGLWDEVIRCPGMSPVAVAHSCGALTPKTLLAHCNYVSDDDLKLIAASGAHVVYCPRTHAAFGHDPHRFRDMLNMGINVTLGTDSLASNPSLSILDELRFLHREHPEFDPLTLIELVTNRAARALGFQQSLGSLTPGQAADMVALPLDMNGECNPVLNTLQSGLSPHSTFVRGVQHAMPQSPNASLGY